MPLDYDNENKLKGLAPILDEHAEWYGHVMRRVFYLEEYQPNDVLEVPESFTNWVDEVEQSEAIEKITLDRLVRLHAELQNLSIDLVRMAETADRRPEIKQFDSFVNIYDDFVFQLRRLERDSLQAESGLDGLTGLRNHDVLMKDLEREMERRSRRGKPFSLVLARVDNFPHIQSIQSDQKTDICIMGVAKQIKKCIRSFDDAYRLNDGEFIMCLKHADTSGGAASIARLRRFLEEEPLKIEENGNLYDLTMSYCVSEPLPGDNVAQLLNNMRDDLNRYVSEKDTALEYFEQSPLQRFVKTMEDT